jgi:uncharacterized protein (DUF488 family)
VDLFTVGYEKATPDTLRGLLRAQRVDLVVDVRAIAASRRPGFSKRQLAAGLEEAGIAYMHLRGLGTPAEGRQAARAHKDAELRRIYAAHLETLEAQRDLAELEQLVASNRRPCILCLEHDHRHCHRTLIAEELAGHMSMEVHHLAVAPPPG